MMTRTEPALLRWLDGLTLLANICGSVLILGLMVLIGVDVLGRNLAGAPLSGVPELVSLSIVAIVFLQAPQALKAGRMTRSDALLNWVGARRPTAKRVLETLYDLLGMAVVGVIVFATWPIFARAWERNEFVGAVGDFTAPTWPVKAMIIVGGGLLTLQFAARILRRFVGGADGRV